MKARLLTLLCLAGSLTAASAAHPNFVFILFDDMGIGDVSCYNPNSAVKTIHMDSLAAAGMRFTNAHSASGICSPTRYSIMTGDHPVRIGRTAMVQKQYDDNWLDIAKPTTVAQFLKAQGYHTGYVGKWHLGYYVFNSSGAPFGKLSATEKKNHPDWSRGIKGHQYDQGFDHVFGHPSSADIPPYKYYFNDTWLDFQSKWITRATAESSGIADKPKDGTPVRTIRSGWMDREWDFNFIQRRFQDSAVSYIAQRKGDGKPFFLFVGLSAPHTPNVPHPDYQGKTPHNYTDYILECDGVVGAIVAALREEGFLDNTIIIVTSDNGANATSANVMTHRGTGVIDGKNIRGQKGDAWEGGHRVPYLVRWGDGSAKGSVIRPGTVNGELLNLQDFYRTAAAILDTSLDSATANDSWNMLEAYLGDGSIAGIREAQFSASGGGALAITGYLEGNEWKAIFTSGSGGGFSQPKGTRTNPLLEFGKLPLAHVQLFDMTNDPHESTNLLSNGMSDDEKAVLQKLHGLMKEYLETGRSNARDPDTTRLPVVSAALPAVHHPLLSVTVRWSPESHSLRIDPEEPGALSVEVVTLQGRTVFSGKFTTASGSLLVPLPHIGRGTYLLQLTKGGSPVGRSRFVVP